MVWNDNKWYFSKLRHGLAVLGKQKRKRWKWSPIANSSSRLEGSAAVAAGIADSDSSGCCRSQNTNPAGWYRIDFDRYKLPLDATGCDYITKYDRRLWG